MGVTRIFGLRPPTTRALADLRAANAISEKAFREALRIVEEMVLEERTLTVSGIESRAKQLAISESDLLSVLRLYANLREGFLTEPSKGRFGEELSSLGLDSRKSELLWDSYTANRERIEAQLKSSIRDQFGPTISKFRWRVDKPTGGSDPLSLEPVGVLGITLETSTDSRDERIEIDLVTLDRLIEELSNLRRELAKVESLSGGDTPQGRPRNRKG